MKYLLSTLLVLTSLSFLVAVSGCQDSEANHPCANILEGRVVSTSNRCAGVAIQVLNANPRRSNFNTWAFNSWTECPDSVTTHIFDNVFWTYSCDMSVNDQQVIEEFWKLSVNEGPQTVTERFRFIIEEYDYKLGGDCLICSLGIPNSERLRTHKIKIISQEPDCSGV